MRNPCCLTFSRYLIFGHIKRKIILSKILINLARIERGCRFSTSVQIPVCEHRHHGQPSNSQAIFENENVYMNTRWMNGAYVRAALFKTIGHMSSNAEIKLLGTRKRLF